MRFIPISRKLGCGSISQALSTTNLFCVGPDFFITYEEERRKAGSSAWATIRSPGLTSTSRTRPSALQRVYLKRICEIRDRLAGSAARLRDVAAHYIAGEQLPAKESGRGWWRENDLARRMADLEAHS